MSDYPIDPEELAAFLDKRLSPEKRAEVLMHLARSEEAFEVFASAGLTRVNPFRPTDPISPGLFVGRRVEIQKLARTLTQTRAGEPENFAIIGDRGLGKSSLLFYLKALAEGRLPHGFNFLVIDTDIETTTTEASLLAKIVLALERTLAKSERARALITELWNLLQRVEAAGVSIKQSQPQSDDLAIERFAYGLAETVNEVTLGNRKLFRAQFDGVLLIIDEADNASPSLRLGSFLKLLLERLKRSDCRRFMVGIAGLPQVVNVLTESHRSALRLFDITYLEPLNEIESAAIITKGISFAHDLNHQVFSVTPQALEMLVQMSDGIPHHIQQLAHSAFAASDDSIVDELDVAEGTFNPHGGMESLALHHGWAETFRTGKQDGRWAMLSAIAFEPAGKLSLDALVDIAPHDKLQALLRRLELDGLVRTDESAPRTVRIANNTLRLWVRHRETVEDE